MSNVCECGICKKRRVVKNRFKFFRCCGVLHSVNENLLGKGASRLDITHLVPTIKEKVEDELIDVVEDEIHNSKRLKNKDK